ncbi:MAG: PTS sugar transporter subunit IIA [Gammaproteobacteria bacterium]
MSMGEILVRDRVALQVDLCSKKGVLEALARLIADQPETSDEVFRSLITRERLGSTGLGRGVAIPHGRTAHGDQPRGAFIYAKTGVDFDAIDEKPVDLFFALLVPAQCHDEHLRILAELAEMFSDEEFVSRIRACTGADTLYELLSAWPDRPRSYVVGHN